MNIHYLELFYHVAKNRGISPAVRKMPYGIQQPAVSAQILRLEEDLGAALFQRRPFRLTIAGAELFRFIEPFFAQLDEAEARIRGATKERLRLAASGPVLRNHFPALLTAHRRDYPALRLSLRETNQGEAETLLQTNEIDLAITELEGRSPPGITRRVILELPLAFLVLKNSRWKNAGQLLKSAAEREPFVALPAEETLTRLFQKGFARRRADLAIGVEVSSLESLMTYVAGGFGVGLGLSNPSVEMKSEVHALPIKEFPPLLVGALWVGKLPAIAQSFLEKVERYANGIR